MNIYSGSDDGLGAALTNPTLLSFEKGKIQNAYPVQFRGVVYLDAEGAYQAHKGRLQDRAKDQLMIDVIAAKFQQHPRLLHTVRKRGGVEYLRTCTHYVGSRVTGKWEGAGEQSRFIRNLITAYVIAESLEELM